MHAVRKLIETLILPPAGVLILACTGLLLRSRWRRCGNALVAAALLMLAVLSMPICSQGLWNSLETFQALTPKEFVDGAGAIVILSADMNVADEYGGDTVGVLTLQRLRYGAWLHRATGVPLLVSGGALAPDHESLGQLMAKALLQEFQLPVRWVEAQSLDTWGNAKESAAILLPEGIQVVYLVTSAYHMPRAKAAFEKAGFTVVPAPTDVGTQGGGVRLADFLPRASALFQSTLALHEWIGRFWYRLSGRS